ncbi:MAG: Xaa-Pro peptidase family protein [Pseudomonadota bacterium]
MPDFPVREFEDRLNHLQKQMHTAKIEAILLTTEPEIRYYAGFRTQFWQSPTRPWFLILPATGHACAIIPEIGAALMSRTWIDDIQTWPSPCPEDDGISLLRNALDSYSRVGILKGPETHLQMPLANFEHLQSTLRHTEFVDATELVRAQRMVKSEAEISITAEICRIASQGFANAPQLFSAGQPQSEAFRAFKMELLRQGADDVPYLVGGAAQGGYEDIISPPSDTLLSNGDVLMLDTGATLNGYFCDFDRNFAIGAPSDEARHAYATLYRATEAALEKARPGITCQALFEVMQNVIGGTDESVGRYGHGLGIQLTEPPSLAAFDQTVLKEGMIMTIEPSIAIPGGKFMVTEENIVIRDGAPELLTERAAEELPVL